MLLMSWPHGKILLMWLVLGKPLLPFLMEMKASGMRQRVLVPSFHVSSSSLAALPQIVAEEIWFAKKAACFCFDECVVTQTLGADPKARQQQAVCEHNPGIMSQQQPERPVTYKDVFTNVWGQIADEAVTMEDASLMQGAETRATGHTLKHGAASMMQSAADWNIHHGFVSKHSHSPVADVGVSVAETVLPGALLRTEYVAGQPVVQSASPISTMPSLACTRAITIGEALEAAAVAAGNTPIEDRDVRAIQSAEVRATGSKSVMPGGLAATAQTAAAVNLSAADKTHPLTLGQILTDATCHLPADKVVTQEDAAKVRAAELRTGESEVIPGGVADSMQTAADLNEEAGFLSGGTHSRIIPVEGPPPHAHKSC